jgi:hypothetical protein
MIKYIVLWILITVVSVVLVFWIAMLAPAVQRIDCTWAEISPDFSTAMREACRKARTK